ncbi:uncharacterized protein BDV14DRAFT_50095 [Aspergillus stella-maris]|uniref:uncharacterized protein n=1 Tax=Aspergillus stella-maris TaxID=1810926 RepID=UPI003CCCCA17
MNVPLHGIKWRGGAGERPFLPLPCWIPCLHRTFHTGMPGSFLTRKERPHLPLPILRVLTAASYVVDRRVVRHSLLLGSSRSTEHLPISFTSGTEVPTRHALTADSKSETTQSLGRASAWARVPTFRYPARYPSGDKSQDSRTSPLDTEHPSDEARERDQKEVGGPARVSTSQVSTDRRKITKSIT